MTTSLWCWYVVTATSSQVHSAQCSSTMDTTHTVESVISLGLLVFRWDFRRVLNSNWAKDQPKSEVVFAEQFAETKLRTERSMNPKLSNSPVDFTYTKQVNQLEIKFWWTIITSLFRWFKDKQRNMAKLAMSRRWWCAAVIGWTQLQLRPKLSCFVSSLWSQQKTDPKSEMTQ